MFLRILLVVLAISGFAVGTNAQQVQVDPDVAPYKRLNTPLSGEVTVFGASAMKKTMESWAEAFTKLYPNVKFQLTHKGSSTAAAPLVMGVSQLAPMGRELWDCELTQFRFTWGYLPLGLRVSRGSYNIPQRSQILTVYVNKDNPIQKLTLAQLDAIFSKSRKRGYKEDITTWGQLGVTGEWAAHPINLYGLNEDSTGVAEWFRVNALLKGKWRDSVTEQPGPKELIQKITDDRFGIGFTGVSYLDPNIKIVALSESDSGPFSSGSMADVLGGKYPLTRSMYIYINKTPGKPIDRIIKEFLAFVLSKEGQEAVVKAGELLPLTQAVVIQEKAKLDKTE